jgi:hypothetical protein
LRGTYYLYLYQFQLNMQLKTVVINIFILLSTLTAKAQYIDPGSGSYIFQIILGGFLAFVFYFKTIKYRIGLLFKSLKKKKDAR